MNKMKKLFSILIITIFLGSMTGCGTEPAAHTTKFSDAKGEWTLDSVFVDTKGQKQKTNTKTDMVLDDSSMTVTVTSKKGSPKTDTYTVSSSSDGQFTVSNGGESIEYTFNYDPGADLLHLYNTDSKGKLVHTIYREYTEALPWDDGNAETK